MALASLFLGGLIVILPADARVRGTELALGALAEIRGDDAALVERAKALELGWTPAPGYSRVLARWQIEQKLALALPGTTVEFQGSAACRIAPECARVAGTALEATARAELASLFGTREAAIEAGAHLADLEVPLGKAAPRLKAAIDRREQRAGAWSVPVQVWIDGTLYQTVWAAFQVELWDQLPVLARDVRRGEVLGPADCEMRRVKLGSDLGSAPLAAAAIPGAVALRDLAAGAVIAERDVQRARLVQTGDLVHLQVRKGAVLARGRAVARSDGAIGERVRVLTQEGAREISGTVVGRGLVEVDLGTRR